MADSNRRHGRSHVGENQELFPFSLSSDSLVVGRKTLVAASYLSTKNLGDKKNLLDGRDVEYFDCCCDKLYGFQVLEESLKTTRFIGVRSQIFPLNNGSLFLPPKKILKGSVSIKIRQPIGAQTFRRLAHVKRHVPNRNETSGSFS